MTGDLGSEFELFSGLHHRLLDEIWESATRAVLPRSSVLYRSGDACRAIPFVVKGSIRILATSSEGREIMLQQLASGNCCALSLNCALSGEPYTACAKVPEETIVFLLPVREVRCWSERDESFRRNVARIELCDWNALRLVSRGDERAAELARLYGRCRVKS